MGTKLNPRLKKIDDNIYLLNGKMSSNIYYLDFDKTAIIDTGHPAECEKNYDIFEQNGFLLDKIDYIINTHSHGDHVGSNVFLKKLNPKIKIIGSGKYYGFQELRKNTGILKGSEDDFEEYFIDMEVKDNDEIDLGSHKLKVYETFGHTDDSLSYYLKNKNYLFSGDIIYYKTITQLNYYKDLLMSLDELIGTYKRLELVDIELFLPGHGPVINDPKENIKFCLKKLERFKKNPDLIIINNLVPSAEYFIHKNSGCSIENIKEYFIKNMMKFKEYSIYKKVDPDDFNIITDRIIGLMKLMNLINIENNRLYLKNELNQYLETDK